MLLTIFTPTYNRAYKLPSLFQSLQAQTSSDFEWLIVDDGSTDDTESLVRGWIQSITTFPIRYYRQENGGKHRAVNKGLREAKGQLFFIVDSDDVLTPDAVAWIKSEFVDIADDDRYAGLSGIRIFPNGDKIGGGPDFGMIDCSALEVRDKYHVAGDLAELFKLEVFREYPFPEFDDEKFCPEALVWHRIAKHYKLRYVHKGIYVCDYLPDGLTAKIVAVRHRSPLASMTYYSELLQIETRFKKKMRASINFWRFFKVRHAKAAAKMGMFNAYSLLAFPCGLFAKSIDYLRRQV